MEIIASQEDTSQEQHASNYVIMIEFVYRKN